MNKYGHAETVAADYDDDPTRPAGNQLIRIVRATGASLTILMSSPIGALFAWRSDFAPAYLVVCIIVSVASVPLIMVFWSKEVRWKDGRLSILTIAVVSVLTWFVEFMLSVFIVVVVYAVLR